MQDVYHQQCLVPGMKALGSPGMSEAFRFKGQARQGYPYQIRQHTAIFWQLKPLFPAPAAQRPPLDLITKIITTLNLPPILITTTPETTQDSADLLRQESLGCPAHLAGDACMQWTGPEMRRQQMSFLRNASFKASNKRSSCHSYCGYVYYTCAAFKGSIAGCPSDVFPQAKGP